MTIDQMKAKLKSFELRQIETAISLEGDYDDIAFIDAPTIRLSRSYNVTFQDPSVPDGSKFKRYQCMPDDEFYLKGVRKTAKNLIFICEGNENVKRNMRRHGKGPGLRLIPNTAEFTLAMIKGENMNAERFLSDVISMVERQIMMVKPDEDIERGEAWGSW